MANTFSFSEIFTIQSNKSTSINGRKHTKITQIIMTYDVTGNMMILTWRFAPMTRVELEIRIRSVSLYLSSNKHTQLASMHSCVWSTRWCCSSLWHPSARTQHGDIESSPKLAGWSVAAADCVSSACLPCMCKPRMQRFRIWGKLKIWK